MLPVSLSGSTAWRPTDLVDEPLDRLLPPRSNSLLEGMQLSLAVPTRVSALELGKELKGGLIRLLFEALDHFRPVIREDVTLASSPFVIEHSVCLCADRHAASSSVFAPSVYTSKERCILSRGEPSRELDTEFSEELHRAEVRPPLESTGTDRPRHPQGLHPSITRGGINNLRS